MYITAVRVEHLICKSKKINKKDATLNILYNYSHSLSSYNNNNLYQLKNYKTITATKNKNYNKSLKKNT